jgi:hypothetical protein
MPLLVQCEICKGMHVVKEMNDTRKAFELVYTCTQNNEEVKERVEKGSW